MSSVLPTPFWRDSEDILTDRDYFVGQFDTTLCAVSPISVSACETGFALWAFFPDGRIDLVHAVWPLAIMRCISEPKPKVRPIVQDGPQGYQSEPDGVWQVKAASARPFCHIMLSGMMGDITLTSPIDRLGDCCLLCCLRCASREPQTEVLHPSLNLDERIDMLHLSLEPVDLPIGPVKLTLHRSPDALLLILRDDGHQRCHDARQGIGWRNRSGCTFLLGTRTPVGIAHQTPKVVGSLICPMVPVLVPAVANLRDQHPNEVHECARCLSLPEAECLHEFGSEILPAGSECCEVLHVRHEGLFDAINGTFHLGTEIGRRFCECCCCCLSHLSILKPQIWGDMADLLGQRKNLECKARARASSAGAKSFVFNDLRLTQPLAHPLYGRVAFSREVVWIRDSGLIVTSKMTVAEECIVYGHYWENSVKFTRSAGVDGSDRRRKGEGTVGLTDRCRQSIIGIRTLALIIFMAFYPIAVSTKTLIDITRNSVDNFKVIRDLCLTTILNTITIDMIDLKCSHIIKTTPDARASQVVDGSFPSAVAVCFMCLIGIWRRNTFRHSIVYHIATLIVMVYSVSNFTAAQPFSSSTVQNRL
jgi:hypothetical protein